KIFFAIESENRRLERLQNRERIIVEEKTEPRRTEHAQLCFQNGWGRCSVEAGFLHQSIELFRQDGRLFFLANQIVSFPVEREAGNELWFGQSSRTTDHL